MNTASADTKTARDTATQSKRWQPPPVHPSRTTSDSKLGASDKGSDFVKGEMPPEYTTDDKKNAANVAASTKPIPENSMAANQTSSKRPTATGRRLLSAYARTMVGLNPVWLAAEALSSSRKPFTQFNRGRKDLFDAVTELSGGRDVVVVVDEKIRALGRGFSKDKDGEDEEKGGAREVAERTAEIVRAAGENAILVVTSSLASFQSSLSSSSDSQPQHGIAPNLEPTLAALKEHLHHVKENVDARAALLLLDRSLKHPVLVAGVREFAETRGIPHADAVLRLASLGISRVLRSFPETEAAATAAGETAHRNEEVKIEEVSAEELERTASPAERAEAERVGRAGRNMGADNLNAARAQRVEDLEEKPEGDPYEAMRKRTDCVVQ